MYDVVRGPLVWVAFLVFLFGLIYQAIRFYALTKGKDPLYVNVPIPPEGAGKQSILNRFVSRLSSLPRTVWGTHPLIMVVTSIFHLCLILTPLFVLGHNILLDESWGKRLWSFTEGTTDVLTVIVLICVAYFLVRRIFLKRVRVITTAYDYLILAISVAPFLTGYMAYHQCVHYKTIILLHILAGEVMLVAIPFTKLGHLMFFFFYRFLIGSEYSFSKGSRTWW